MSIYYKRPSGDECKMTNCARYENYKSWRCGDHEITFCVHCKHSQVSQYKKKE